MNECPYCRGEKYILTTRNDFSKKGEFMPGLEVSIEAVDRLYILAVSDVCDQTDRVVNGFTTINYCPMCGKKLRGEKNEKDSYIIRTGV